MIALVNSQAGTVQQDLQDQHVLLIVGMDFTFLKMKLVTMQML